MKMQKLKRHIDSSNEQYITKSNESTRFFNETVPLKNEDPNKSIVPKYTKKLKV